MRHRDCVVVATSLPRAGASLAYQYAPYRKLTLEEDAKLTDAVTEIGNSDWVQVGALAQGRTHAQGCKRGCQTLNPDTNKGK
jgi:hypothetical protein